ncbi:MAG: 30S ribosomal protein S6, partial [candidate division Zixibacteria bacterium]|nr:30S ribosomal protein S6 [candidate division Zixibacteria bacterium]
MRLYETTFILGPQADEATFDRQIKAISDLIERNQGKIVKEQRTGIRRLAYPIRKFTQGYYTRFIFEGNNTLLNELERFYKLEEPYIRFLTVVFEGDPEVDYESRFGHFRGGRGGRSYDSDSPRDRG